MQMHLVSIWIPRPLCSRFLSRLAFSIYLSIFNLEVYTKVNQTEQNYLYRIQISEDHHNKCDYFTRLIARRISSNDHPGPPGTISAQTSSGTASSWPSKLQLGLGSDLIHSKSSTWHHRSSESGPSWSSAYIENCISISYRV